MVSITYISIIRNQPYLVLFLCTQLFTKIDLLQKAGQQKKITDIFCLYAQTLVEFYPEFETKKNWVLAETSLGKQLFTLLIIIIKKMPVKSIYYDGSTPVFLYDLIIDTILNEEKNQIISFQILIIDGQNEYSLYLESLKVYILMSQLIFKVRKEQSKMIDISFKDEIISKAEIFYEKLILTLSSQIYGLYCYNFKKITEKVKFIFRQKNEKQALKNNVDGMETESYLNFKIPQLYSKYSTAQQKSLFITRSMEGLMKIAFKNNIELEKIQKLCLIYLKQFKNKEVEKSHIFIFLLSIKVVRMESAFEKIEEQLKEIIEFKPPMLFSINILVSALLTFGNELKVYEIMKYLLKFYKDFHTLEEREYLKLTVLAFIIQSKKNKANLSAIPDQLIKIPEVLMYLNSIESIDFLIGIFLSSISGDFIESNGIWDEQQRKELNFFIKCYLMKSCKDQDPLEHDVKFQQILPLLLTKRNQMYQNIFQYSHRLSGQVFSCRILQLLYSSIKGEEPSIILEKCITILTQYSLSFKEKPIHFEVLKILFIVLCKYLNFFNYYSELLIAFELIGLKVNYEHLKNWIIKNKVFIDEELWPCIFSYDLVEIFCEASNSYWEMGEKWITEEQNYQHTTLIKKQKTIHKKTIKFGQMLFRKLNL